MNKKNLLLSVPLAAGIIMTGCSAQEEGQEDDILQEEESMNETEGTESDSVNTDSESDSIDSEGSDEDNEGSLNEVPEDEYGEGTDEVDKDTEEGEEF
ncbi:hypothetical protein V1502_08715 [Bacillus sp. SCS-153A]|uniref:hypothetical protein n=1 Tax=Rossellomorea sedimentorum TaxID=3115294 RepID=UPI0039058453